MKNPLETAGFSRRRLQSSAGCPPVVRRVISIGKLASSARRRQVWILVCLGTDDGTMTKRIRISLITAVAIGALASPAAGFAQNNLIATVGTNDSQVITLTHENGAPVNDIPAGTYTIEVRDRSSMHNFHLTGPGVERETSVGAVQTVTWTVTFDNEARYVFVCDPHSSTMRGSFTTGGDRLRRRLLRLHLRWDRRCTPPSAPASRSRSERGGVRGSRGSGPVGTRSSCAIAPPRTTSTSTDAA